MKYICYDCCKKLGRAFGGWAVNEAGRKNCSFCGTSEPLRLDILSDEAVPGTQT